MLYGILIMLMISIIQSLIRYIIVILIKMNSYIGDDNAIDRLIAMMYEKFSLEQFDEEQDNVLISISRGKYRRLQNAVVDFSKAMLNLVNENKKRAKEMIELEKKCSDDLDDGKKIITQINQRMKVKMNQVKEYIKQKNIINQKLLGINANLRRENNDLFEWKPKIENAKAVEKQNIELVEKNESLKELNKRICVELKTVTDENESLRLQTKELHKQINIMTIKEEAISDLLKETTVIPKKKTRKSFTDSKREYEEFIASMEERIFVLKKENEMLSSKIVFLEHRIMELEDTEMPKPIIKKVKSKDMQHMIDIIFINEVIDRLRSVYPDIGKQYQDISEKRNKFCHSRGYFENATKKDIINRIQGLNYILGQRTFDLIKAIESTNESVVFGSPK